MSENIRDFFINFCESLTPENENASELISQKIDELSSVAQTNDENDLIAELFGAGSSLEQPANRTSCSRISQSQLNSQLECGESDKTSGHDSGEEEEEIMHIKVLNEYTAGRWRNSLTKKTAKVLIDKVIDQETLSKAFEQLLDFIKSSE
jgi:hypothetical protein